MIFPHFYQLESKDCGPTCLKIIARFYGKDFHINELKEYCSITRAGVSLQDLINGAEALGFGSLPAKLSIENIGRVPLPAILLWRQEHFVVLYKITQKKNRRQYHISDPAYGRIVLKEEDFVTQWINNEGMGVALMLEPTEKFYAIRAGKYNKYDSLAKLGKVLLSIVRSNKARSLLSLFLVAAATVFTWVFPFIFRRMIDEGVMGKNLHLVVMLLAAQFAIFSGQILADSISAILLMKINFEGAMKYLNSYLFKLIRLPLKIFDTKLNFDLILRMEDSDRIQSFLTHYTLEFILSLLNLCVFTIMLYFYSPPSFGIFLFITFFSIGWTLLFLDKRKILDYSRFSVSSRTRNNIYELISEMPEIKINNAHAAKIKKWEGLQNKLNKITLKALYLNYYQLLGANFLNRARDILITGLCSFLVIKGRLTIGSMMTIAFILGQLTRPIDSIIAIIKGLQDAKLSFDRLDEIQCLSEENEGKQISLSTPPQIQISFDNVWFKYEGSFSPFVLRNINLCIPAGKITAIVGASGSGKTTLLKLLLAIYDPSEGNILLDNCPLREVIPDTWRKKCGVVLQNGYIYSGTYAENIALAEENPDLEKVKKAAQIACIHDFIENLPLGYATQIGKTGIDLSGGQRQRILIARAVYRDPEFIFLDEATSSLDSQNEKAIMNNLSEFFEGRTVVVIAHRLSTVKNADQIVVMENGEIVEVGCHRNLSVTKGAYFNLVKNQLELGE